MRASTIVVLCAATLPVLSVPMNHVYGRDYDVIDRRTLRDCLDMAGFCVKFACQVGAILPGHLMEATKEKVGDMLDPTPEPARIAKQQKETHDAYEQMMIKNIPWNKSMAQQAGKEAAEVARVKSAAQKAGKEAAEVATAKSTAQQNGKEPAAKAKKEQEKARQHFFNHLIHHDKANSAGNSAAPPDPSQIQPPAQRRANILGQLMARQLLEDTYLD
ncbi:uncharacterized protein FIBRA_08864 [Fibroporia radiculosa]|uniref:Uncharacterized protein n=1 Tax=Fibroporia radiculosa TaxID=599839 RepID=J4ICK8_9APHY|nr:uncharacterized protein FIBRA_08864 [Fibroporia radiculosa]CCM06586.1 predicted protein [Fibroporia radiculosa]